MQHRESISRSFSSNAENYLASSIHSSGADLKLLARAVASIDKPRVLDLGCGAGHASFAAAPFAREVVAFDLTASMLEVTAAAARERQLSNITTRGGSVEKLPFDAGQFDCVVSRYSAHHWIDLPRALREVRRVLKPGGKAFFIDVAGSASPLLDTHLQCLELLRDPSHVRNYSKNEWLSLFRDLSFEARIDAEWRLDLEFSSWISRIGTPADRVAAIRSLWSCAPLEVRSYFNLRDDLSFEIDAALIVANR
jgi:ubiquinone/menaquinone biosynthesis C-methylase UbiE